jgi:hypothetical protein
VLTKVRLSGCIDGRGGEKLCIKIRREGRQSDLSVATLFFSRAQDHKLTQVKAAQHEVAADVGRKSYLPCCQFA